MKCCSDCLVHVNACSVRCLCSSFTHKREGSGEQSRRQCDKAAACKQRAGSETCKWVEPEPPEGNAERMVGKMVCKGHSKRAQKRLRSGQAA